jgi:lipopolysaccharide biosynthesis regulator YciM
MDLLYLAQRRLEVKIGLRDGERQFVQDNRNHPTVRVFYNLYKKSLTDESSLSALAEALRDLRTLIGR